MKKILVPVDFSDNSRDAFIYAQKLAFHLKASLQILHVTQQTTSTTFPSPLDTFEKEIEASEQELDSFFEDHVRTSGVDVLDQSKISKKVIYGSTTQVILELINSKEVDLVVLGTTGKSGILVHLLGSVSNYLAKHSNCPVLLVPEGMKFIKYEDILYASDFESSTNQLLEEIANIAAIFSAKVHLVHVQGEKSSPDFQLEELVLEQIFEELAPNAQTKYVTVWDKNIWNGLNVYARDQMIDLIVMVKPHRNFLDSLLHNSVTDKMIHQSESPILILPIDS